MGLLDDLEQQAQQERDSKEEVLKQKREFFKGTTLPVMENLYDYLTRLTKSLNFLKAPRLGRYQITGYGEVVTRCDNDMNVQAQVPMYGRTYTLTCTGIVDASQSPTIMIEGASRIEAMIELFRRYGFEAMERAEKNEKGDLTKAHFRAWGKVPMTAVFTAEMQSDLLKMEFTNFDSFGTRKQTVRISELNDEFFDSIGKYIALQQNYILRESISDENREAWRSKLQQEQTRREWEQKISEAQKAEEDRLKKAQQGNRITGSFKAITGEFPKPATGQQKAVTGQQAAVATPIPPQGGKPSDSPSGLFQKIGSLFGKKDK
ncbi:MAG: hypothetical protein IPO95_12000 [Rhodanobacteraceae bacterium]|nr:hypothetical protein [Rhodanobacteraceae bacterium]MBL0042482.1 hypothetical protein [Xanthomonadales bacterium]MBP6077270.1 hypothetical protein [Xanthomonadales bacterium]MBP7624604.1 hypothetical protein [Xanthomonadales bacterium]